MDKCDGADLWDVIAWELSWRTRRWIGCSESEHDCEFYICRLSESSHKSRAGSSYHLIRMIIPTLLLMLGIQILSRHSGLSMTTEIPMAMSPGLAMGLPQAYSTETAIARPKEPPCISPWRSPRELPRISLISTRGCRSEDPRGCRSGAPHGHNHVCCLGLGGPQGSCLGHILMELPTGGAMEDVSDIVTHHLEGSARA